MVLRENFERFPETRLGKLVKYDEILQVSSFIFVVARLGVELLSRG